MKTRARGARRRVNLEDPDDQPTGASLCSASLIAASAARNRCALLLRQVAALDDSETGVDVGVIDSVGRKTGERWIGLDCLVDVA